jgi:hypothetical protein
MLSPLLADKVRLHILELDLEQELSEQGTWSGSDHDGRSATILLAFPPNGLAVSGDLDMCDACLYEIMLYGKYRLDHRGPEARGTSIARCSVTTSSFADTLEPAAFGGASIELVRY